MRVTLVVDLPSPVRTMTEFLRWCSRTHIRRAEVIDRILAHCAWKVRDGVEAELSLDEIVARGEPGARMPGARG